MDNYKHVPQFLYGLSAAQMEMFMNDDNPYNRQSQKVTEVSDVIQSPFPFLFCQVHSVASMQQSWDGVFLVNFRKAFLLRGATMSLVCTPCQACMRALQVTAWVWAWGAAWAWAWAEEGEDIEEWEALLQIFRHCYWTLELYFLECLWEINFLPLHYS